jgi:uncharacterized protein RhaS with RHS repeats
MTIAVDRFLKRILHSFRAASISQVRARHDAARTTHHTLFSATAGQTAGPTWASTTTTYDALGGPTHVTDGGGGTLTHAYSGNDTYRVVGPAPTGENTQRKQFEYDAQGRLPSVCEVTSLTGQQDTHVLLIIGVNTSP